MYMTNKNNNKNILVIGSLNMDFVIEVDKMPVNKETVHGNTFTLVPGGKGANEAYALGKMGANVTMLGAVGKDEYGKTLIENLKSVNVDTSKIKKVADVNTGCAFISVDKNGDNSITVVAGANKSLTTDIIDKNIKLIEDSDIIIMQLEIPIDVVTYAAKIAKEKGKLVILDPAPAVNNIPKELLKNIDIIKPNEIEIQVLTKVKVRKPKDLLKASYKLIEKGVSKVITTLGSQGAYLVTKDKYEYFKPIKVKAVDTTAAGDTFVAALVKSLMEEKTIEESIFYAIVASSITVTKKGAQTSIPTLKEIEKKLKEIKNDKNNN